MATATRTRSSKTATPAQPARTLAEIRAEVAAEQRRLATPVTPAAKRTPVNGTQNTQTPATKVVRRQRPAAKTGNPQQDTKASQTTPEPTRPVRQRKPAPTSAEPSYDVEYILVGGDFEVHRPGCADVKKAIAAKKTDYATPGHTAVTSYRQLVLELWDDQIRENYDGTPDLADPENPSLTWLAEHAYTNGIIIKPCVAKAFRVAAETARPAPAPVTTDPATARRAAKQDLARRVLLAIEEAVSNLPADSAARSAFTQAECAQFAAFWVHHLPTGQSEPKSDQAKRHPRWWPTTLPIPDRSDWR